MDMESGGLHYNLPRHQPKSRLWSKESQYTSTKFESYEVAACWWPYSQFLLQAQSLQGIPQGIRDGGQAESRAEHRCPAESA